mmetsp:Transcript_31751/g.37853  ORF Transcript_31751/g.37853 Transcript_31751/m.37853 type:complete len:82 (-) Transcript_31751:54-299(-)
MATSDKKRLSVTPVVSQTSSNMGALLKSADELLGVKAVGEKAIAGASMSANSAVLKVFMIRLGFGLFMLRLIVLSTLVHSN